MEIKITKVVKGNFNDVVELKVKKAQEKYISSNVMTLSESTLSPYFQLFHHRAICMNEKVVGFVEYQLGEIGEFDEEECTIWRFMIDRKHQNIGIGKIAMGLLLEEIKAHKRCKLVDVYYEPQNIVAKKLYNSYGFKEVGDREDGTVIAVMTL